MVTRRISWFKRNPKKVLKKIYYGNIVIQLLDPGLYLIVKKRNVILIYERIRDGIYENKKLAHKFQVKGDYINDLTCDSKDCPYLTAVALKFNWLHLPKGYTELTTWRCMSSVDSNYHKWRIALHNKSGIIYYQFKDKFNKLQITHGQLNNFMYPFIHELMPRLIKKGRLRGKMTQPTSEKVGKLMSEGNKSWLNLKPYRNINLSKIAKEILCKKIDASESAVELS